MRSDYFTAIVVIIVLAGTFIYLFGFTEPPKDAIRADIGNDVNEQVNENVVVSGGQENVGENSNENNEENSNGENFIVNQLTDINMDISSFEFEGFGPGKSHIGTFDDWTGSIILDNDEISGIEGNIQASSVNTGISGLDDHLKTDDFFNVEEFPEISFNSESIENDLLTGSLTFLGITKSISFPVIVTSEFISADFILDTSQFGDMNPAANDEVRIAFEFFR